MLEEVAFKDQTHPQHYSWSQLIRDSFLWLRQLFRGKYPIFTIEATKGRKVEIFDSSGRKVNWVKWYDANRREAGMYILSSVSEDGHKNFVTSNRKLALARVKLPGSYVVIDGVRY